MRLSLLIATLAGSGAAFAQPADGQPFRIFFDWSKPELTRDGQEILDRVAAAYQQRQPSRIEIAGHTDRSGSNAINLAASRRRADEAKAYLAAHGVPVGVMTVSAYGESQPVVPTADGVREMQNRRVEIIFR